MMMKMVLKVSGCNAQSTTVYHINCISQLHDDDDEYLCHNGYFEEPNADDC